MGGRLLIPFLGGLLVLPAGAADTANQQAMKADLLVVTAHPDDETGMAAAMARYADAGKVVALACCTRGEGGGNGTGTESGPALGAVREAELRRCLAALGTRHLFFLDRTDFAYTESVRATFAKWDKDATLERLVRVVRLVRPDVVCTMNPAPTGGQHGHHQAAGRLATEAFDAAADPERFRHHLRDEGLKPWAVRKLYWSAGDGATVKVVTGGKAAGVLASPDKSYADLARAAARFHRSQGFDKFFVTLPGKDAPPPRSSGFLLVKSRVPANPAEEPDLFTNVGDPAPAAGDLLAAAAARMTGPLSVRLRGRDNAEEYRLWLIANGLGRLDSRLPARVTAVAGRDAGRVFVEVTNPTAEPRAGAVSLAVPAGLTAEPTGEELTVPARATRTARFRVAVPAGTGVGSHPITVRFGELTDAGTVEVVPSFAVAGLKEPLPVDADPGKWAAAGVTPTPIPHTNVVQGRVAGPAECSGRFFVGTDAAGLQVLAEVTDDTVARNLAPDDIKAHWRTTSLELCIDPTPPSENTLSAFKLGIVPADTAGKVRAARDADARPGELTRIGSKVRLASRLTPTGYVVEAHVPWAEAGFPGGRPKAGTELGFNVILYHAGKKDAGVGEDVGKARLAWSFWPGVPGRPEVWGRLLLR